VLKRAHVPLKRDVVFLATSDEEIGAGVGAAWIVQRRPDLVRDAEFLLNEGGEIHADARGAVEYYGIATTEKSPFWLDIIARGTAGHGSRPTPDNPVHRLVRALDRIAAWRTSLIVTPTVDRYFRDLATVVPDTVQRRWFADIATALQDSNVARAITANIGYNAILRNTISITGLKGSEKTNVIPPVATAALDVRLLPGQDPAAFLADLIRVVGDSGVTFRPQGPNWPATESSTDTDLFRALVAVAHARHAHARRLHRQPLFPPARHHVLWDRTLSAHARRGDRCARQRRARQHRRAAFWRAVLLRRRDARRRELISRRRSDSILAARAPTTPSPPLTMVEKVRW